jgi:hypothetical protein
MSCGTGECGCGCEDFVELKSKKSLRVIEEATECGDGTCGCGCVDFSDKAARHAQAED